MRWKAALGFLFGNERSSQASEAHCYSFIYRVSVPDLVQKQKGCWFPCETGDTKCAYVNVGVWVHTDVCVCTEGFIISFYFLKNMEWPHGLAAGLVWVLHSPPRCDLILHTTSIRDTDARIRCFTTMWRRLIHTLNEQEGFSLPTGEWNPKQVWGRQVKRCKSTSCFMSIHNLCYVMICRWVEQIFNKYIRVKLWTSMHMFIPGAAALWMETLLLCSVRHYASLEGQGGRWRHKICTSA